MTNVAEAFVSIRPDFGGFGPEVEKGVKGPISQVEKSLDSATGKASKFGSTLGDVGKIAGGFIAANVIAGAGQALVGFFNDSTKAASDQNETLSKSNTIFGESAKEIEQWAQGAAKGFGQSKTQALDAAGTFGNMFTQLGIGAPVAAKMSTQMTELASDFASFHNADVSDVIDAQTAAFRGEYDALQRFVPTINAASVEQRALEMTGKATTKELTAQEKALAVNALMMEGAGAAMGDFARTSDGAANKTRILEASQADLTAQLGEKLLPIQLAITKAKLAMVDVIVTKVIPVIEELVQKHWPAVSKAIDSVVKVVQENWPLISDVIAFVFDFVKTKIEGFIQSAKAIIEIVTSVVNLVSDLFHGRWSDAWGEMKDIAGGFLDLLIGYVKMTFGNIPETILGLLGKAVSAAGDLGKGILKGIMDFVETIPEKIKGALSGLASIVTSAFNGILNGAIGYLRGAVNSIIGLINDAINAYNKLPLAPNIGTIGYLGSSASGPAPGPEVYEDPYLQYAHGTNYVPNDGLAYLHRGEAVVPAAYNRGATAGSEGGIVVNMPNAVINARDREDAERGAGDMAYGLMVAVGRRGYAL